MSLIYERTGGFTGVQQRLEIDLAQKKVRVKDRRAGAGERELTAEEQRDAEKLVARAREAKAPPPAEPRASDSFTLKIWLDGEEEPRWQSKVMVVPVAGTDWSPWGDLCCFADKLLTGEIDRLKAPKAAKVLSPDDLKK